MPLRALLAITVLCTVLSIPGIASARSGPPEEPGAERTVALFYTLCYATLPDIDAISKIASANNWSPITGDALKQFEPPLKADVVKAWTFNDLGIAFGISVTKQTHVQQITKKIPGFENASIYSCTIFLPGTEPQELIADQMEKVIKRPPGAVQERDDYKVSIWSGSNDKAVVYVYHYRPKTGAPGGSLVVSLLVK